MNRLKSLQWAWQSMTLIPAFRRQRRQENLCKFEANLVYIETPGHPRLHGETLSQSKQKRNKLKPQCCTTNNVPQKFSFLYFVFVFEATHSCVALAGLEYLLFLNKKFIAWDSEMDEGIEAPDNLRFISKTHRKVEERNKSRKLSSHLYINAVLHLPLHKHILHMSAHAPPN